MAPRSLKECVSPPVFYARALNRFMKQKEEMTVLTILVKP